jgi:hypothetical protein
MADFRDTTMRGSTFDHVDLGELTFTACDISDVSLRGGRLRGLRLAGVDLVDIEISGELQNVRVNGIDVAPLLDAELLRRHPDLALMRPSDAAGFRTAWDTVERLWAATVEHARTLDPALLHASVDGEWSFIETLRHLCFATDAWVRRGLLGDPSPWHPLDLPWDQMPDTPGVPRDRDVRPSLDEVLEVRRDRMATVRRYVDALTDAALDDRTEPVPGPGWPPPQSFPVREPLLVVLNEEWWHRRFAERDLAVLESRSD